MFFDSVLHTTTIEAHMLRNPHLSMLSTLVKISEVTNTLYPVCRWKIRSCSTLSSWVSKLKGCQSLSKIILIDTFATVE